MSTIEFLWQKASEVLSDYRNDLSCVRVCAELHGVIVNVPNRPTNVNIREFAAKRKGTAGNNEAMLLAVCIAAIVFSIDVAIGDTGAGSRRYLDVPIEVLALLGLASLPFCWSRDWLLSLLLVCVLGSSLLAGTFLSGFRYVAIASFGFFLLPTLYEKCRWKESLFANTMRITAVCLGVAVLLNPFNPNGRYDLWHAYPFTGSKLSAGMVFSVAICVCLTRFGKQGAKARAINVGMLIGFLCMIFFLEARAPIFSLALAFALFAYRRNMTSFVVSALVGALLLAGSSFFLDKSSMRYQRVHDRYVETKAFDNDSFHGRVRSWQNYLSAAKYYPLGMGFERSLREFEFGRESHRDMFVYGAHSEFLKLLVELGWGPFFLFLVLNIRTLSCCVRAPVCKEQESLHLILSMMFVTILPQLLANNEMQQPEVSLFYWFAMGTLLRLNELSGGTRGRRLAGERNGSVELDRSTWPQAALGRSVREKPARLPLSKMGRMSL
jgi:hypothetical protein